MLSSPNAILSSDSSSMKVLLQGTGTLTVPGGTSNTATATIPHGYGDNNLLWQVVVTETDGSATNNFVTPYLTNDSQVKGVSTLDSTNLYITISTSSGGTPWPVTTWNYTYRILVP